MPDIRSERAVYLNNHNGNNGNGTYVNSLPIVEQTTVDEDDESIDLRQLLNIVKHRFHLIAAVTLGVTAVTALWTFNQEPKYRGSFRLLVEPVTQGLPEEREKLSLLEAQWTGLDYDTQIEVLRATGLDLERVIRTVPQWENLAVLTSGDIPPDPTRLLSSKRMQELMERLNIQQYYDLIIYDTPPLLGFADGRILAARTNGVILVVKMGKTDRSLLKQNIDSLKTLNVSVLGLVANVEQTIKTVDAPILFSTFFLTLLLMVGLFFFIRASVKDRTEQIKLLTSEPEEVLLEQLQKYFEERAYRVTDIDAAKNQVTFQGFVQPSLFLAIFLTALAALGLFCLALVLALLSPAAGNFVWLLLFLAPTAGIFYWRKAGRLERVLLKVETSTPEQNYQKFLTVTAHRDELIQLRQALPLQVVE